MKFCKVCEEYLNSIPSMSSFISIPILCWNSVRYSGKLVLLNFSLYSCFLPLDIFAGRQTLQNIVSHQLQLCSSSPQSPIRALELETKPSRRLKFQNQREGPY